MIAGLCERNSIKTMNMIGTLSNKQPAKSYGNLLKIYFDINAVIIWLYREGFTVSDSKDDQYGTRCELDDYDNTSGLLDELMNLFEQAIASA